MEFGPVALLWTALVAGGAQGASVSWQRILDQPRRWYSTAEAQTIADAVVRYQRASGGWPKNIDMTRPPDGTASDASDATFDNGATTTQIRFLALVGTPRHRDAAVRGLRYVLAAQYPNGGWPQFFPLPNDYSRHVTFNDNAMVNVLTLLEDVAGTKDPFGFVDADLRQRAASAVTRAIPLILKAQIVVDGTLTAWCAQHDEVTLEPRGARTYEHPSISGAESVGIVRFLMRQPRTPAIERAVDGAVAWLRSVQLKDGRWARFYEIGTNRPIFSGRDGVIRYDISEIEAERRDGYAWFGTWGRALVDKEYPGWKNVKLQLRNSRTVFGRRSGRPEPIETRAYSIY
jgi:PelA/Pel-15E family pectate lyase